MEKFAVTFIVKESGQKVTKEFESAYLCRKFINKLRFSKRLTLVSYPNIN